VHLAFDADWRSNLHIAHVLSQIALAVVKAGYEIQVEDWDARVAKGIDNLLAAGYRPAMQPVALAFGAVLRGYTCTSAATLPTIPAAEVRPWHSSL
jgi:hypothetical protein